MSDWIANELSTYKSRQWHYRRLARLVEGFLEPRVKEYFSQRPGKALFLSQHRAKSLHSVERKLKRRAPGQGLLSLGDLAGVRLIFYFRDELDRFSEKLHQELLDWFGIEAADTWEQRIDPSSDHFGYDSYHFTLQVNSRTGFGSALDHVDQNRLATMKCEVQLRSLLQHAWAETEHDLRYKLPSGDLMPPDIKATDRRRWVILAGLLEAADNELVARKNHLELVRASEASVSTWEYSPSKIGAAFEWKGTRYAYVLIDEVSERTIDVELEWAMFDLDKRLLREGLLNGFKRSVWSQLCDMHPDFAEQLAAYDASVVRLVSWDGQAGRAILQPALYSDAVVTNHVLAGPIRSVPTGPEVRDLAFKSDGVLRDFSDSPLTNSIGVSCVVRTGDDRWVIGLRGSTLVFDPGKWGCPASGVLGWGVPEAWGVWDFRNWLATTVAARCAAELGLRVSPREFRYLGLARELRRLGKPQALFLLDLTLTAGEARLPCPLVRNHWRVYARDVQISALEFIDDSKAYALCGSKDAPAKAGLTGDVSEELRMNLALALRYREHL